MKETQEDQDENEPNYLALTHFYNQIVPPFKVGEFRNSKYSGLPEALSAKIGSWELNQHIVIVVDGQWEVDEIEFPPSCTIINLGVEKRQLFVATAGTPGGDDLNLKHGELEKHKPITRKPKREPDKPETSVDYRSGEENKVNTPINYKNYEMPVEVRDYGLKPKPILVRIFNFLSKRAMPYSKDFEYFREVAVHKDPKQSEYRNSVVYYPELKQFMTILRDKNTGQLVGYRVNDEKKYNETRLRLVRAL
ncbi:hypothetical protein [Fluviicola sp.]|uniref:hypothetical protein n=1 Tax=Fluviicola sp. TaxID=1917219 RepID=UPI003D2C5CEE